MSQQFSFETVCYLRNRDTSITSLTVCQEKKTPKISLEKHFKGGDMIDTADIQVSFLHENPDEPQTPASEAEGVNGRSGWIRHNFLERLLSNWQAVLIGILTVLLLGMTSGLISQMATQRHLTVQWQQMELKLQMQLKQLLNSTDPNSSECDPLKVFINEMLHSFPLLSAGNTQVNLLLKNTSEENTRLNLLLKNTSEENTQLNLLLKNTSENKRQLERENENLNKFLQSTQEKCDLVNEENRQLNYLLNDSMRNNTLASAESKHCRMLMDSEQQITTQLRAENKHQRSILFSNRLSFIWNLCDKDTLQCSRCLPGWTEHASRCFLLSQDIKKWEDARRTCLDMAGDLAVVLSVDDQMFFTNMVYQSAQQAPEDFHSAWIGLQDMVKEGTYFWVNGDRNHPDVTYWLSGEPNNAIASWDNSLAGQDCVVIVPPRNTEDNDWFHSWDDIICAGERNYLCETMALNLT